jgi:hypothetical protein
MHGLARYLTKAGSSVEPAADDQFITGTTAELRLSTPSKGEVIGPDGNRSPITTDGSGAFQLEIDKPGIFSIRDGEGHEGRKLAANLPVGESDLAAVAPAEFEKQLVRGEITVTNSLSAAGPQNSQSNERHFWQMLMIAALVLLLLEPLAANRMYA